MAPTNLLGLDLAGLEGFFTEIGEKPFRARQLLQWIHQYQVVNFEDMTNLSKTLRQALSEKATDHLGSRPFFRERTVAG